MEKQNPNVNAGARIESVGTKENKMQTFDDVLSNKEYQAEFDKRVQKAIETSKRKWHAKKLEKMNKEHIEKTKHFNKTGYTEWYIPVNKVGKNLNYPIVIINNNQFYFTVRN